MINVSAALERAVPVAACMYTAQYGCLPHARRACQIVVGTPGRICALLEHGALQPSNFHMLVLDEADSLMAESFADDVQWIYEVLPPTKQVIQP